MGKIEDARRTIDLNIRTNGAQEITGGVLNVVLNDMMDATEEVSNVLPNKVDKEQGKGLSSNDFTDAHKTAVDALPEQFVKIESEIEKKANQDGKYPQLTSGFASNLVGRGESTESEFSFRASGGKSIEDGAARISELRGNGLVWNNDLQLRVANATYEKIGDYSYLATANGTPGTPGSMYYSSGDFFFGKAVANHKYLVSCKYTRKSKRTDIADFTPTDFAVHCGNRDSSYSVNIGESININQFITPTKGGDIYVSLNDCIVQIDRPQSIDLTLMFGAGNEPTTIEEFYARKPIGVDDYAYNEGTLIPFNADAIKSVGDNMFSAQWVRANIDENGAVYEDNKDYLMITDDFIKVLPKMQYTTLIPQYNNKVPTVYWYFYDANKQFISSIFYDKTITTPSNAHYVMLRLYCDGGIPLDYEGFMLALVHSGYKVENGLTYQPYEDFVRAIDPRIREVFPNGMKPWDKVYNKNGKGYIVKGSGEVDLGTLDYVAGSNNRLYSKGLKDVAKGADDTTSKGNIVSSRLIADTSAHVYNNSNDRIAVIDTAGTLYLYDSEYIGNPSGFKAAMAGVPLWYELAEPEVIEYDEPFNLDYEVWDFGTEEIIASEPCAPISADIIYQFNAVDTIRNNQIEIAELKAMIATMQAQMASMASNEDVIE